MDIVRNPCDVRTESLYVLIQTQGGCTIVVGSSKTFSGHSTDSLGLTDALVTISLRWSYDANVG